jgi:hypothetical protein
MLWVQRRHGWHFCRHPAAVWRLFDEQYRIQHREPTDLRLVGCALQSGLGRLNRKRHGHGLREPAAVLEHGSSSDGAALGQAAGQTLYPALQVAPPLIGDGKR